MATLDVITVAKAKVALNIAAANTDHDTELAAYVTAVSLAMDKMFGPIVQRSVTEAHDGGGAIFLRSYPVASITSVAERSGTTATTLAAENFAAPTANDYQVDLLAGILDRRSGGWPSTFAYGSQNIIVTYVAGRFANTAAVDANFQEAAAITVSHLWRPEQGVATGPFGAENVGQLPLTFAFPNAAMQLLPGEKRAPAIA